MDVVNIIWLAALGGFWFFIAIGEDYVAWKSNKKSFHILIPITITVVIFLMSISPYLVWTTLMLIFCSLGTFKMLIDYDIQLVPFLYYKELGIKLIPALPILALFTLFFL